NIIERNAPDPGVTRIDILIALRIVELFDAGIDNAISRHSLAVVDTRFSDLQAIVGLRRNVLQQVFWEATAYGLRSEAHHQTVAMGELQILVHPGLRLLRQFGSQLARRKHHL